jgi:hypothetical protein
MRDAGSFDVVAREWFELTKGNWEAEYADLILHRLESDLFPLLGRCPMAEITPVELLSALRRIERGGALDTAHRVLRKCRLIFSTPS